MHFPSEIPEEDIDLIIGEWKLAGVRVRDTRAIGCRTSVIHCSVEGRDVYYDHMADGGGLRVCFDSLVDVAKILKLGERKTSG